MERLDVYLVRMGYAHTRSYAAKLIHAGRVAVAGKTVTKASAPVSDTDEILCLDFEPEAVSLLPEEIPLSICYEDDDLLVVDKPQGMAVHPSKGHETGTLVHALLGLCEARRRAGGRGMLSAIGGEIRPGIVHRLDKDTSGLVVVAKNDRAHLLLSKQFEERAVERIYSALVHGHPVPEGVISTKMARHPVHRLRMAVVTGDRGRDAITRFRCLELYPRHALVEARLETGRTHQIRVHLAHIGHPIVGDPVYGREQDAKRFGAAQILHSGRIRFSHPVTGAPIEVRSPLPPYFLKAIEAVR